MKKVLLALAAAAAFSGSAYAADLPARMPLKAAPPPPLPIASWTGCYVGGGGGWGMWNDERTGIVGPPLVATRSQITDNIDFGGRGWFGTVQGGCDYQFGLGTQQFVIGAFADYDWADIHGKVIPQIFGPFSGILEGEQKLSSQWAVGGRVGWVVLPRLMTFVSAGYTESTFDRINFNINFPPFPSSGIFQDKQRVKGWFVGAGDEYGIGWLPGLFWKTEYRVSQFDVQNNPFLINNTATGLSEDSKKWVQTVRSELVYRFNWGGPAVSGY